MPASELRNCAINFLFSVRFLKLIVIIQMLIYLLYLSYHSSRSEADSSSIKVRDSRPIITNTLFDTQSSFKTYEAPEDPTTFRPTSSTPTFTPEEFRQIYLKAQIQASEQIFQEYIEKRKRLVGPDPSKVIPWPPQMVMYYWDYFLPTFSCPHTIQRIGRLGDGGKWVCGFELFENPPKKASILYPKERVPSSCTVYSFGVAQESSFEGEILRRTNCEIYAYDGSVDRMGYQLPNPHPRLHFNKKFIGGAENGSLTLGMLMKENGHNWIDIMKMDIESNEINVLDQIMNEFKVLPFGQLQLEIHGDQEGKTFPQVYKLWEKMEQLGLRPFKNEINHWPCVRARIFPIYIEYSFINIIANHTLTI